MDRAQGDYMGMLATVINALAHAGRAREGGRRRRASMTAIEIRQVAEPYIRRRAIRHLEKGRIVIFAAGTGQPVLLDGHGRRAPRDGDPRGLPLQGHEGRGDLRAATRFTTRTRSMYTQMTFDRFLAERIGVMDSTAVTLCRDNNMPIRVFKMATHGNIKRVVLGEPIGTIVEG